VPLKRRNKAPLVRKSGSNGAEYYFELRINSLRASQGQWALALLIWNAHVRIWGYMLR
jgi:hypothetical protein